MFLTLRDGCRLHVRVLGRGQPLILLHGFGLDSRQWLPYALSCAHNRTVIVPDIRGHGLSAKQPGRESTPIETLVEDLEEIVCHLDLPSFKLAGYSLGAIIGMSYLTTWPHKGRVNDYLHIEAGPRFHNDDEWTFGFNQRAVQKARELIRAAPPTVYSATRLEDLPRAFRRAYREFMWMLTNIAFPPGVLRRMLHRTPNRLCQPWLPDWKIACWMFRWLLYEGFDYTPYLGHISSPVELVAARHSEYFPPESIEFMQQQIANARLTLFAESGHGLMFSEPVKFFQIFRQYALR